MQVILFSVNQNQVLGCFAILILVSCINTDFRLNFKGKIHYLIDVSQIAQCLNQFTYLEKANYNHSNVDTKLSNKPTTNPY